MPKWTEEELREKRIKFALWLATPDSARNPKTQYELAEQLGVAPETVARWRDHPTVIEIKSNAVGYMMNDVLWDVVKKTKEAALVGTAQDRRLYFQLGGYLDKEKRKDTQDIQTEVKIVFEQPDNCQT